MITEKRRALAALTYPNFRWVCCGQIISQIGSAGHTIAIAFYLKAAFESGTVVGSVVFLSGIASLLCLPLAGVLADRHNRRSIILICDAVNAITAIVLGVMFFIAPAGSASLAYLAVFCSFAVKVTSTFFRPAFGATLPDLVPRRELSGANALYKAGARSGDLAGQALGGIVYRLLGPGLLFLLDGLSYLVAIACVMRARPKTLFSPRKEGETGQRRSVLQEFFQGVRVITDLPGGALFLSMALLINFFATPILVLMPFHIVNQLKGDAATLGVVVGALSAGVLSGYACAAKWPISGARGPVSVVLTILMMCFFFILFSLSRSALFAGLSLLAAGIANGYWSIYFETTIQRMVAREALGRVYACFGLLSAGLTPAAALLGGIALDRMGQRTVPLFVLCAVVMTLYPFLLLFNRRFVSFFSYLKARDDAV